MSKCAKENTGLEMRVIELNVPITQSAEHSDAINKSVCENYGHIAPIFAQYLSSIGTEKADEAYKRWLLSLGSMGNDGTRLPCLLL